MIEPQNPYKSFIVPASAGSGKTYQLSRRFLYLVGAGARPEQILTLTFTNKAASEMRERILQDAAHLLGSDSACQDFSKQLLQFQSGEDPTLTPPPRSGQEVAQLILSHSQLLNITTIDSIFLSWVRKFPIEASASKEELWFPYDFSIIEDWQQKEAQKKSLDFAITSHIADFPKNFELKDFPIRKWQDPLTSLDRFQSFYWLTMKQQGGVPFLPHPSSGCQFLDLSQLVSSLQHEFLNLVEELNPAIRSDILESIKNHELSALYRHGILTKSHTISGSRIKGAKRDRLSQDILKIEEGMQSFYDRVKIEKLNLIGQFFALIYRSFLLHFTKEKTRQGLYQFDDLTKGAYQLMYSHEATGARYLLQRKMNHLLLDEFQDTSLLQWSIFTPIVNELLSGAGDIEGSLAPTLFIVGDEKQAIYGFRETDPEIMTSLVEKMGESHGVETIPLSESFRTAQLILDLVNEIFEKRFDNFPRHESARIKGALMVPNYASICLAPLIIDDDPLKKEAECLASHLYHALRGEKPLMVVDKATKALRPLRPKDCVVLYRNKTHAAIFEEALRAKGLPTKREGGTGFWQRCEVLDMIALLKLICYPEDRLALSQLLKSPLVRIEEDQFLQRMLVEKAPLSAFLPDLAVLLGNRSRLKPHELILRFLEGRDGFHRYQKAFDGSEGQIASANILSFIERIYRFEREGHHSPLQLLSHIKRRQQSDQDLEAEVATDAILLMTIHKSKGLEFYHVSLIESALPWVKEERYWTKCLDEDLGYGVHYIGKKEEQPSLKSFKDTLTKGTKRDHAESERVLYVALTRARQHLLITGSQKPRKKSGEESESHFYGQIHQAMTKLRAEATEEGGVELTSLPSLDAPPVPKKILKVPPPRPCIREDIPFEILSLAPHRLLSKGSSNTLESSVPYAREVGVAIHQGLEQVLLGKELPAMESLLLGVSEKDPDYPTCLKMVREDLEKVLSSSTWQELMSQYIRIWPELPMVLLDKKTLYRGQADLVLQGESHWHVIDFKSKRGLSADTSDDELREHALEQGYDLQLASYAQMIQAIHGPKTIRKSILFTHLARLCPL